MGTIVSGKGLFWVDKLFEMGISLQERDQLKQSILKAAQEAPDELAKIMQEVSVELAKSPKEDSPHALPPDREKLIQEIFDEYEVVFRALA